MLGRTSSAHSHQTLDSLRSPSFRSSTTSTTQQDFDSGEYLWTPPAPDPNYWVNVAKARNIRQSIIKLKDYLNYVLQAPASAQRTDDYHKVTAEIRARERKMMRYVDHYILCFDDVLLPEHEYQVRQQKYELKHVSSSELGTISPPMSPANAAGPRALSPQLLPPSGIPSLGSKGMGPKRPVNFNIDVPPRFASGSLPPTPTTLDTPVESHSPSLSPQQAASPPLGSQAFINSYKQNVRYQQASSIANSLTNSSVDLRKEKPKHKPLWGGLFGSKNVRAADKFEDNNNDDALRASDFANNVAKQQQQQLTKMASSPSLAQLRASRKMSEPQGIYIL
ncbi:hypothetical protein LPJ73_000630 [Coemansia sp. RSA 2703]|nr:hypothetical protein LPJ73_000630 [Coemansia sp. RSA 2703]